jgi:hypothetical protein
MSPTQPSSTSARALYLSNWQDMMAIWMAGKLSQIDLSNAGPRIGELHYLGGSLARRGVNQIVDYSGFFATRARMPVTRKSRTSTRKAGLKAMRTPEQLACPYMSPAFCFLI